jgi:prephenate dehydratase
MDLVALGPEGTYGHETALKSLGYLRGKYERVRIRFRDKNEDVLKAAAYGRCLAVVPIGNSKAGIVDAVAQFWLQQPSGIPLFVIGEIHLPVMQHLLARDTIRSVDQLKGVLSHEKALDQCGFNLRRLNIRRRRPVDSTARAAAMVAGQHRLRKWGALGSLFAAQTYDLQVLEPDVHDQEGNFTRFHLLGPDPALPSNRENRTAALVTARNNPNVENRLRDAIGSFGDWNSVSVVARGDESISCYCEFKGHQKFDPCRAVLADFRKIGSTRVLGSYPLL